MDEEELFYLRKLHFLVDFSWNLKVYKPLLQVAQLYGVGSLDALQKLIGTSETPKHGLSRNWQEVSDFLARFDELSRSEWFDSPEQIEDYFAEERNFEALINYEFEKLNVLFSVVLLKDFKSAFDTAIRDAIASFGRVPEDVLGEAAALTFAIFPPLDADVGERTISLSENLMDLVEETANGASPWPERRVIQLVESPKRHQVLDVLRNAQGQTLSKILNTQSISLRDLQLTIRANFDFDAAFRRSGASSFA